MTQLKRSILIGLVAMLLLTSGIGYIAVIADPGLGITVSYNAATYTITVDITDMDNNKNYYLKYYSPAGGLEATHGPFISSVDHWDTTDTLTLSPTPFHYGGPWTIKLIEIAEVKKWKKVDVDIETVRTVDSTFSALKTSFAQGETVYVKGIGYDPLHGSGTEEGYWYLMFFKGATLKYTSTWIKATSAWDITYSQALGLADPTGTWTIEVYCAEHKALHGSTTFTVTPYVPPTVSITITSSPAGSGFVKVDGTAYDTPHDFDWTPGDTHTLEALSPVAGPTGTQYVWTSWSDTGDQTHDYTVPSSTATVTANYKTQWLQTFASSGLEPDATGTLVSVTITGGQPAGTHTIDVPSGTRWVDNGATVSYTFTDPVLSTISGKQYRLDSLSPPSSGYVVSSANTITATYKTQYYLTVTSPYDTPTPTSDWFDAGTSIAASVTSPWPVGATDTRYVCTGWTGTGSAPASGTGTSVGFNINAPSSISWNWKTQYCVTLGQSGVGGDFAGTVVTIDSSDYGVSGLPASFWWDSGSTHDFAFQSPLTVTTNVKQYVWTSTTGLSTAESDSITISGSGSVVGNYKTQFHLNVLSAHDTPGGQGWYDDGATAHATLSTGTVSGDIGVQFVFTNWGGDASGTGLSSDPITMDSAKTATANWQSQYLLTVATSGLASGAYPTNVYLGGSSVGTAYDGSAFTKWFNENDLTGTIGVDSPVSGAAGTQYMFVKWGEDLSTDNPRSSVAMNGPKTFTAAYQTQFYLTVTSAHDTLGGQGWYDSGATAYATLVTGTVPDGPGVQYIFTGWSGDASGTGLSSNPITMNGPKAAVANWKTQYQVTFSVYPLGAGSTSPSGTPWLDEGSNAISASANLGYQFLKWTATGSISFADENSASTTATVNGQGTITANFKVGITIASSPAGSGFVKVDSNPVTTPAVFYWEAGSAHDLEALSPVADGPGVQYIWLGWSNTGFQTHSYTVPSSPATVTADYKTQFYVTFSQSGIGSDSGTNTVVTIGGFDKNAGDLPISDWFDSGTTYSYAAFVATSDPGKRYANTGVTGPASPIAAAGTVTGTYKIQVKITFDQSGLDSSATGTVVTVAGSDKAFADLPFTTDWLDSGGSITFGYVGMVASSASGKRFALLSTSETSPLTIPDHPITVTGSYETQWKVTFAQSGVGVDFLGTVVVVDASNYGVGALSVDFWWVAGSTHNFAFQSPLVVTPDAKQYVWTSTAGLSTLQSDTLTISSSGTVTGNYVAQYKVLFTQSGLNPVATGTVVTVGGVPHVFADLPFLTDWFDTGSSLTYAYEPIVASTNAGERFRLDHVDGPVSPIVVTEYTIVTGNYVTQFYITVTSVHDTPTASDWVDAGNDFPTSVTSPDVVGTGHQWVCTGYEIDGGSLTAGTSYEFTDVDAAHTIVFSWKEQFYLTMSTNFGSVLPGSGWHDVGTVLTVSATAPPAGVGERYVWNGWTGSGTESYSGAANPANNAVTMNGPITEIASWTHQFYLTVTSAHDTAGGEGWYDSGVTAHATLDVGIVSGGAGIQFVFTGWSGGASGTGLTSDDILMNAAKTATANWKTQFYLTMTTTHGNVLPGSGWHDAGSAVAISASAPIAMLGERYVWLGWTGSGTGSYTGALNPAGITMNGPITEAAAWRHEFSLTVVSPYDAPNPAVGLHWYAVGTTINAVVTSPAPGPTGTQYVCTGWTGSGSVPATGSITAVTFVIGAPSSITWNWNIQFYLNVSSAHGTVGGEGWYDPGTTAYALVTPLIVEEPGGIRYVFINWTGDATGNTSPSDPILMDKSKTAVANWDLELRLDVVSAYDSPYGAGWYKPNATANFGVTTPVDHGNGTIRIFVSWSGDATGSEPTGTIVMTKPSEVIASWQTQYLVTFNTTLPNGSRLTIPGVPQALPPGLDIFGTFYVAGSTAAGGPAPLITPGPEGTRYVFKGWDLDGVLLTPGTDFSFMVNSPHNASMVFDTEFLLVVNATGVAAPFNATLTIAASPPVPYRLTPTSAVEEWYRKNVGLTLLISTPNKIGHGVWAVFKQWSGNAQGVDKSVSLVMSAPKMVNAVFSSTNPVAESIPYSIVAGLICFGLAYLMTRSKKGEGNKKGEEKGFSRLTFGIAVSAIAILVAAIMSAMIATGYGINVGELPDLTNWAVLFLGAEAIVLFYATYRFLRAGQPRKTQAATETAKVPANPYGV